IARGAAADTAAPDRCPAPVDGGRVAVPDRRRGHRLDRGPGLPHLPGAALPGHGRDPALCGVDHAAGGGGGLAAAALAHARLWLGGAGALMATVSVRNVWMRY